MSSSARLALVLVVPLFMLQGCSNAPLDPCSLLGIGEAQLFDATISSSMAFPPQGAEKNELCVYSNANGDPRLMVFVWSDPAIDPVDATKSGMSEGDTRIVEIAGVGDKAAAGFGSGQLKLFAARNSKGMIGVRVRDPITQRDAKFDEVKALVAKLLARLG
jgi:hypothetical protein